MAENQLQKKVDLRAVENVMKIILSIVKIVKSILG